jgi:squalene/oxidosqualene cyclase-like protein
MIGSPTVSIRGAFRPDQPDAPTDGAAGPAIRRALDNLARRQTESGAWAGDYGGPMFLLPMYVSLAYAARAVPDGHRSGFLRYFAGVQGDGDRLGLHSEDRRGSMFTSVLGYVAQRLLGVSADAPHLVRLRRWIHANGSPLGAASWGKFTLCLLGLYDWSGIHPIQPELWLLPPLAPIHPRRLWCHCRQVYLPMAWLYGRRATIPEDPLIRAVRDELYGPGGYTTIDWGLQRDVVSPTDEYRPPTARLRAAHRAQAAFERVCPPSLRRRAMDRVLEHILYEDRVTQNVHLGPVNKVLNAFVHLARAPGGPDLKRSLASFEEYLWVGDDGTKMQGYNGSQLWDTAFALQSALAAGALGSDDTHRAMVERAYSYVRDTQIEDDVPDRERYYRDRSRGGWPFSTRAHGWPITDCTSEALKCALALEGRYANAIPDRLVRDAVDLILSWQNDDGGWATYERQRAGVWLEALNPSQVFGDIMVDSSYVECTSACIQALAKARANAPSPVAHRIDRAVAKAQRFIRAAQRPDGSFEGSWGVCFVYGTWFGVTGLLAAGARPRDAAIERACAFILDRQRADGGWGEHGDSCRERRYVEADAGSATQTAWALSTLVRAGHPDHRAQQLAAEWLTARQRADGAWPREPMVGVFNKTCLINYDNYRHYFPLWALAEWSLTRGGTPFAR